MVFGIPTHGISNHLSTYPRYIGPLPIAFLPLTMVYQTPYPWYIKPPMYGISNPSPWHVDPPSQSRSNLLSMVY